MMFIRNALMCMAIALGTVAIPTEAGAVVVIEIGVPPPAPRYERVPPLSLHSSPPMTSTR